MSHCRSNSYVPGGGAMGRPLAQEPRTHSIRKNVFPAQVQSRTIPISASPAPSYQEDGQRRHEKEEARSLRDALQQMDVQDDVGLHQAAQDEATELVWMHQNPGKEFKNPYAPYQNPDSSRRSQSPVRSGSHGYASSHRFSQSAGSNGSSDSHPSPESLRKRSSLAGTAKKNLKVNFKLPEEEPPAEPVVPKPRTVSSDSSKGIFRNPNDHIYEEPVDTQKEDEEKPDFSRSDSSALRNKPRNALGRVPKPLPWLRDRGTNSSPISDKISRFEIHKNPPTQSRNAGYTRNESTPTPPPEDPKEEPVPTREGREIRSDDIRAATSKRRGDRSEKLPMPSAVSDRVGRPIVSFDKTWKPVDQPKPDRPTLPIIEVAAPAIEVSAPSIEVSEPPPIPVINVPDIKVPTISEFETPSEQGNKPTKPARTSPTKQGFPRQPASESQNRWYTPYTRSGGPTASCELCSLPISGKIVTAGGCRFHPECFTCYHCHTALECVAFYQEPQSSRDERLATEVNDREARVPRFYCHLDFHEMFSPRCKSCKTPIEGEVVVACGAEWHVGHFFCAECGDVCLF
jgi:hypothetical protein